MKIAIVTDSTAYLPVSLSEQLPIYMIPLSVIINGQTYEEEVDITSAEFYDKVRGADSLPKTSQPSLGRFMELYESIAQDYDAVISIHLSSGISGTYTGSLQASEMIENLDVHLFDSEISCYLQGFYVLRAAQLAQENATIDEIISELNDMKTTMRAYFMVDDLTHLQKGGRLSGTQALIGGLLQVKPLLHFQNKVIVPFEKIRTRKKAMKRIVDILAEDAENHLLEAAIIHANRPEEAQLWLEELSKQLPTVRFTISYFGPVIGTHLGEGAMGLGWVKRRVDVNEF